MNHFKSSRNPVFFIAEIGGNHEGSFESARRMLHLAAESGADAAKFQVYTGETLVNGTLDPARVEHFNKFMLSIDQYRALADEAEHLGLLFMASVWNFEALDALQDKIKIHKVGSGDLTFYPMLAALVKTGKPIILSTGMSTLEEIKEAVAFINSIDASYVKQGKLALLQCTSMYPIPDEDANLNAMLVLKKEFECPVGYSDHTLGTLACEVAFAMGAEILEKHFTDTRENQTFRDHTLSLTRDEVRALLNKCAQIKKLQGSFEKKVMRSEEEHRITMRRGVFPGRDLTKGAQLSSDDLVCLRPDKGIGAKDFYKVVGTKTTARLGRNQLMTWEMIEK